MQTIIGGSLLGADTAGSAAEHAMVHSVMPDFLSWPDAGPSQWPIGMFAIGWCVPGVAAAGVMPNGIASTVTSSSNLAISIRTRET